MNNNFNKNQVLQEIVNQAELIIKTQGLAALKVKYFKSNTINDAEFDALTTGDLNTQYSQFGLPTFDVLSFNAFRYDDQNGVNISLSGLDFPIALMDVSMTKNVITTQIQGRNGTIKEYISDGDYSINIKGVLVGDGQNVYPEDLVKQLIKYIRCPQEIPISSPILNDMYNISSIVIIDHNIGQNEGMRNVVPFELTALSETPFEIKSKENA
jgi:hypothetical protein